MAKVLSVVNQLGELIGYGVVCPACTEADDGSMHVFMKKMADGSPGWSFNGDMEKPTFTPSMLSTSSRTRCHSFVTNGHIHYLHDCSHRMAGQTIDLPDVDDKLENK